MIRGSSMGTFHPVPGDHERDERNERPANEYSEKGQEHAAISCAGTFMLQSEGGAVLPIACNAPVIAT